jgi:ubiquinone/menaquinone biosynthesis C-methylase UbiE
VTWKPAVGQSKTLTAWPSQFTAEAMMQVNPTERVRNYFDACAPTYDRRASLWESILFAGSRSWVGSHAAGDVLEIGIGTGRNLPFYRVDVRVTGIDLSASMLQSARRRATELRRDVDLQVGDTGALPFPGDRFDTIVCTLTLCCVPDMRRAVAEMKRVLKPGGQLVLLDHVVSDRMLVRAVQRVLEPLWSRFHADSLLRRPLNEVTAQGFQIEWHERFCLGIVERVLARKP